MENQNEIKTVHVIACPHCKKEFHTVVKSIVPSVLWAHTKEELDAAKSKLIDELTPEKFHNASEYSNLLEWVNNESTFIAPEEVKELINQILNNKD
jgi:hypothetical protein